MINGGIKTMQAIHEHLTAVDGVMLGREAYQNPYLFNLFNISSGKGISLEEIVKYANKITNKVFNISYSNLYSNYEFFMYISKSQKELGFEPTNIYEGMEKFWKSLTRN